jgi:hypothetical protein
MGEVFAQGHERAAAKLIMADNVLSRHCARGLLFHIHTDQQAGARTRFLAGTRFFPTTRQLYRFSWCRKADQAVGIAETGHQRIGDDAIHSPCLPSPAFEIVFQSTFQPSANILRDMTHHSNEIEAFSISKSSMHIDGILCDKRWKRLKKWQDAAAHPAILFIDSRSN